MGNSTMVLRIAGGARDGEQVEVDRELTIGRVDADVTLDDDEISRAHLRVAPADVGVRLTDLGSKNGTLLDGERLEGSVVAREGAEIKVGSTTLIVGVAQPADERTALHSSAAAPAAATVAQAAPAAPPPGHAAPAAAPAPGASWTTPPGAHPLVTHKLSPARRLALPAAAAVIAGAIAVAIVLIADKDSKHATAAAVPSQPATPAAAAGHHVPGPNAGTTPVSSGTGTSPHPLAGVVTDNGPTGSFACVKADNGRAGPGHFRFITSACENATSTVATFPLHRGVSGGKTVYYVITDVSKQNVASSLGVNFVPKLANAIGSKAIQKVTLKNGEVVFPATVSFNHTRSVVPGPGSGFPPASAAPPSLADPGYSPLIELPNGTVENAPQIINSTGHAAKVLAVDYQNMSVSYEETEGRYENKHVHYASFDSGMPGPAAIEDVTYSPSLNTVPKPGDEGLKTSSREELVAFVNGPPNTPTFPNNPLRQGENTTVLAQGDPHNLLHETPVLPNHPDIGNLQYAPMWDVHLAQWSPTAVAAGDRTELRAIDDAVDLRLKGGSVSCAQGKQQCAQGLLTGPGGTKFGPSGFVVNCPLISIDAP